MSWIIVSDYDYSSKHAEYGRVFVYPTFRSVHAGIGTESRREALRFASRRQAERACQRGEHVERVRPAVQHMGKRHEDVKPDAPQGGDL